MRKIPYRSVLVKLNQLMLDLQNNGVVQKQWPNYSKLSNDRHHCHLAYHYVAVWRERPRGIFVADEFDGEIEIVITYAGSRGSAPY